VINTVLTAAPKCVWVCAFVFVCVRERERKRESERKRRKKESTINMGWLRLLGSLKSYVSLKNIGLFCRALLQKRPIILGSLLIVATPYHVDGDSEVGMGECVCVCV